MRLEKRWTREGGTSQLLKLTVGGGETVNPGRKGKEGGPNELTTLVRFERKPNGGKDFWEKQGGGRHQPCGWVDILRPSLKRESLCDIRKPEEGISLQRKKNTRRGKGAPPKTD